MGCTGAWIAPNTCDRVVRKVVAGAQAGDEGKTLDVRIHGDTAYAHDVLSPGVLLV